MTGKHYFIEQDSTGRFSVRAKGAERASKILDTQKEAEAHARKLNPSDRPDIERVRNVATGRRNKWRSAHKRREKN